MKKFDNLQRMTKTQKQLQMRRFRKKTFLYLKTSMRALSFCERSARVFLAFSLLCLLRFWLWQSQVETETLKSHFYVLKIFPSKKIRKIFHFQDNFVENFLLFPFLGRPKSENFQGTLKWDKILDLEVFKKVSKVKIKQIIW